MATYYYSSLFKKGDVRITTGFSSSHMALDLSRGVVNTPIYSPNKLGSGTVSSVYTSYTRAGKVYNNSLVVWIKYDNGISVAMYHGEVRHQKVKVGDRVVVGQQIYQTGNTGYSFGDHLHIELWKDGVKINPIPWVLNDNMPVASFKKGDKVIFTGIQNIRSGAGDGFSITRSSVVGEVAEIKDGPRTSQNKQFGKGENDSYIWWDMIFEKGGTGWVADVSKFKIYTPPPVETPTPEEPEQGEDLRECEERVKILERENEGLREGLRASEERLEVLEGNYKLLSKEYDELQDNFDTVEGQRKSIKKELENTISELNALKEQKGWLEKMVSSIIKSIKENINNIRDLIKKN